MPPERMTSADYKELERLARKARWQEIADNNEANADFLNGVSIWASRRV